MATQGEPGSKVVICTDGLANVGIGNFSIYNSPEQMEKADVFYKRVGEVA